MFQNLIGNDCFKMIATYCNLPTQLNLALCNHRFCDLISSRCLKDMVVKINSNQSLSFLNSRWSKQVLGLNIIHWTIPTYNKMGQLLNLKYLGCANNRLDLHSLNVMLSILPQLKQLKSLDLSGNYLGIYANCGALKWHHMSVFLPQITSLGLRDSQLDRSNINILLNPFYLSNLQYLDLSLQVMQSDDLPELGLILSKFAHLTWINLNNLRVYPDTSLTIIDVIRGLNQLTCLNLSDCYLYDDHILELTQVIPHLPLLKILNLSDNAISRIGYKALMSCCINFEWLDLSKNMIRNCYNGTDKVDLRSQITYM